MANGFRMVKLGDLLPGETLDEAFQDARRRLERGEGLGEVQKALVSLLEPHRDALLGKGVVLEYLAWVLTMHVGKGGGGEDTGEIAFQPSDN